MPLDCPAHFTPVSDEVYESRGLVTIVTTGDIAFLKEAALANPRGRARLCAHPTVGDRLHEMLIVLGRGAYVPPHKHVNKSESFHVIEGRLSVLLFDDSGGPLQTIQMGRPGSDEPFFYRLSSSVYHMVLVKSDVVAFHEVTNGPFDRKDMIVAPWAPAEADVEGQARFIAGLLA